VLNKNIKYLRLQKEGGIGQTEFGKLFNLTRGQVDSYEETTNPPIQVLQKIAKHYSLTIDDLINTDLQKKFATGFEKKVQKSIVSDPPIQRIVPLVKPIIVTVDEAGQENIVMVDTKASAGYTKGIQEPEFFKQLPAIKLPGQEFKNALFRAFQVDGDSMIDTLDHGDWVICKYLDGGFADIKEGYIHVIITETDVWVKRVLNRVKQRDKIVLISDNEDYPPREVDGSDVVEIWLVKGRLGFNLHSKRRDFQRNLNSLQADILELRDRMAKLEKKKLS
jgi:phage repressor protein C with HTH and peptisase S24 domain